MSGLAQLQNALQAFVLEGRADIRSDIVTTERVPADTRLAIYFDAYRARLEEALESNFPMLGKLLGDAQFSELARRFIERHRSSHYSIRWYGAQLAEFLASESPYREQPALAELARWEWTMTLAFDASDAVPLSAGALQALVPEQWAEIRLEPHPSVHLLSLRTNAPAIWRALNRDEPPPAFAQDDPRTWLIWRRSLDTYFRSLEANEAQALAFIAGGQSFGALCEMLAEIGDGAAAATEAAKLLRRWIDDALLVSAD